MEKGAIFIDGGYLKEVLKKFFGKPKVDYLKLSNEICSELKLIRLRTYYYDCMPIKREGNEEDIRLYAGKQKFFDKIEKLQRFEVRKGRLQLIGGVFKQKMVDVLMSMDIIEKCCDHQIQHAILIAGDSDFVPAVKRAKDHGAIVHLYYHPSNIRTELLNEIDELHPLADDFIDKIRLQ